MRPRPRHRTVIQEVFVQILFELLFILALSLPPLAVVTSVCVVLASSLINVGTHAADARRAVAVDHPVGR